MTLLSAQRNAAYLLAGASLGAILASGDLPVPVMILLAGGFLASYLVGERVAGKAKLLWQTILVAVLLYLLFLVVFARTLDIVEGSSLFAATLLIYALFNRRTVKDYNLVHLAALLTIAGGAALSAELSFGVCFLIFAVSSTWSLTLTLLRREVEEEAQQNHVADGGASVLRSRRLASARFLAVLAGLAMAALTLAVSVFVLFPRVSLGIWHRQHLGSGQHTGFSGTVDLSGAGLIKDDPTVALRVRMNGSRRWGTSLDTYWRGASLNDYDGHEWHDTIHQMQLLSPRRGEYVLGGRGREIREFSIEITPAVGSDAIFTTGTPNSIAFVRQPGAPRAQHRELLRDGMGNLRYRPTSADSVQYLLRAVPEPDQSLRGLGRSYDELIRRNFTQLPPLDPKVRALAHRLTDGKDPYQAAIDVERYLGKFTYSIDVPRTGRDPLADFLFKTKTGHCEYFATAMAILLRVGGIPTRLVAGYYGGKYVERGNYYAVRQGDAHAWTEVYFPGRGWRTFDATPAVARGALLEKYYAQFELWMDGVRTAWRNFVIEYDLATQVRGLSSLMRVIQGATARLAGASRATLLLSIGRILIRLALLGAILAAAIYVWRSRKPRSRRLESRSETQRRARAIYRELVRRLGHHGIARDAGRTPRELARLVAARQVPNAALVERIVERYLASRYGTVPLDRSELQELERELKQV